MLRILTFLVAFLSSAIAFAHHGGSEYALNQTVEFKAKLTRVDLINPHSWLYFDVTDKDGNISHHRCEMRSVHVLRRSGWSPDLFQVGQQITLEASPNKTDPNSCYLQTILFANGTRMDRYGQYVKAPAGGLQEIRGPIATPKATRALRQPQNKDTITIEYGQFGLKRTVYMNTKQHPQNIKPTRSGHSVGHWEADTLVVDTVRFLPGFLNTPVRNSDKLHVVERFSLDTNRMALTRAYVAEDPTYLKGRYTGSDTVFIADAPFNPGKCQELNFIDYSKQQKR